MPSIGNKKRERSSADETRDSINYYLMKSEPYEFSFSDLESKERKISIWDGVRNYQARNILAGMKVGDLAFFYHSNAKKETGIVGVVEITKEGYPDPTATTPGHKYFDAKIKDGKANPWVSVDVTFRKSFTTPVLLPALRDNPDLKEMQLFKLSRLSVSCVTKQEWEIICGMAGERP